MTARVLLTGGTGYLGKAVLSELSRQGIEVHALVRRAPEAEAPAGVTFHLNDLLAAIPSALLEAIRPTHCLHLAWEATPGRYRTAPENRNWAAATVRLARAFFDAGGGHFTLAGSCAEYALPAAVCDERTTPLAGDCAYALCKTEAARLVAALARAGGGSLANPRIFYVYGPGEPDNKLVSSVCRGLLRGEPVALTACADVVDYVYRTDVANALVAIVLTNSTGAINVASGRAVRVRDIALCLGEMAGRVELLQFGKLPGQREALRLVAATDRLVNEVGYRPCMSLEDGLRRCFQSWQERLGRHSTAQGKSSSLMLEEKPITS